MANLLELSAFNIQQDRVCGYNELPPADPLLYCRSNTRMFGSRRPGVCTVIVKVLRSEESLNRSVPVILPLNLSVISRVCAFTPSCRGRRTGGYVRAHVRIIFPVK